MLKMCSTFTISGPHSPSVTFHYHLSVSQCYHRLYRYAKASFHQWSISSFTIVRNLRIFVHLFTDAMANKLTHYTIRMRLTILLNSISDITNSFTLHCVLDANI